MITDELRLTASKVLDGMTFNKEKLALGCIAVCDLNERLRAALADEQKKSAKLALDLVNFQKNQSQGPRSSDDPATPDFGPMPPDFGDIFGDMFSGKGGKRNG